MQYLLKTCVGKPHYLKIVWNRHVICYCIVNILHRIDLGINNTSLAFQTGWLMAEKLILAEENWKKDSLPPGSATKFLPRFFSPTLNVYSQLFSFTLTFGTAHKTLRSKSREVFLSTFLGSLIVVNSKVHNSDWVILTQTIVTTFYTTGLWNPTSVGYVMKKAHKIIFT